MNENIKYLDYVTKSNYIDTNSINSDFKKINVGILRSFTIDTIIPILKVQLYKENIYGNFFIGEYNQYHQEIFNTNSNLYKFNPDIIIIAIRLEEFYPELFNNFLGIKNNLSQITSYIINEFGSMIEKIKSISNCNIILHNFVLPYNNYTSLYDFQNINGQINFLRKVNYELVNLVNKYTGVYLVDADNISNLIGKLNTEDKKMWYIAKNPYKYEFYISLSNEYVKYIKAIYGFKKKCIILDLDNTLWGGVIGEDGLDGIKLGESYPGKCYKDFQQQLLNLKNRGVLLAICSKNNSEDVDEVLKKHPDMVLKKEDFACIKANWDNKYSNINAISQELNIGLDSLVFIDDSPIECELIKQKIPEVTVITLPKNPLEYPDLIYNLNYFNTISLTEEDFHKTDIYKAQAERMTLKNSYSNLDDYYKSLKMKVEIKEVDDFSVPRIAQLTQKTNQFNLTTKRYSEKDIKEMLQNKEYKLYYIRVIDKFGDNGITGFCILNSIDKYTLYIDTFLLSCRVMGRTIENAFMAFIYNKAKENNIKKLIGEYIPTKKNQSIKDFYKNLGFTKGEDNYYLFDINNNKMEYPNYIKII
ncbi:HAD family hydrolase [Clostridium sp. DJ247]|uniref:HAD-IIIC family phosphatase n=1 Tax=Clostridium sp. DJ247 TaxID=2726188 RepID=UPI0016239684|nr:HAD-IIIC family phosphatase [Clostridium sp. DJ247]MBC2580265.1 HAD-IIIC family phosphatase [Clostridium sp. DJ247]